LVTNSLADFAPIYDIAVANGTVYAAGGTAFLKSTNGGNSWNSLAPLPFTSKAMAVDRTRTGTIYLSVPDKGVYKSSDDGASWQLLAGSPIIGSGSGTGVLHNPLTVHPDTGVVYYGTDHGMFVSSDHGSSWTQGTGFANFDVAMWDVAVSAADTSRIYALANNGSTTVSNLYVSTNGGASWTLLASGVDAERVVPDVQNVNAIYLYGLSAHAVYKSADGGHTFTPSDSGMPSGSSSSGQLLLSGPTGNLFQLPLASNVFLTGIGDLGIFRSANTTQTWALSSNGFSAFVGMALAYDAQTPSTVYFGGTNGGGIWKSTDNGLTWTNLSQSSIHALAVDPFNSAHIIAADFTKGLIDSVDSGSTWQTVTALPTPTGTAYIVGITFSPTQSGTIFVSLRGGGLGVIRSIDGGKSYSVMNAGLTSDAASSAVAIDPKTPTKMYVGTAAGLFKSTDGGGSWSLKTSKVFVMLSIDSKANVIYGSVATNVASGSKSSDSGETWQTVSGAQLMVADPSTANSVFSPDSWSSDAGATWHQVLNGLGQSGLSTANQSGGFTLAPSSPQTLYVVSTTNSVLRVVVGP
jgi:hypothetical protein